MQNMALKISDKYTRMQTCTYDFESIKEMWMEKLVESASLR